MTSSPTPALSVVGAHEHPTSLVIDLPAGTSPEVWKLAERVGAALEELFAAAPGTPQTTPPDRVTTSTSPLRPPAGDTASTRLDLEARSVSRNHDEVHLTRLEFELLVYLARNPSRAISRSELWSHVWNEPAHYNSRTIDVHIRRLRRKLGHELQLTTVRGFGYRLDGWDAAVNASWPATSRCVRPTAPS